MSIDTPLRQLALTLTLAPTQTLNTNLSLLLNKLHVFRNRKQTYGKWRHILRMHVIFYLLNVDSADRPIHKLVTPLIKYFLLSSTSSLFATFV